MGDSPRRQPPVCATVVGHKPFSCRKCLLECHNHALGSAPHTAEFGFYFDEADPTPCRCQHSESQQIHCLAK